VSRLRVLARRVANNWRLKLASLALAVLLWALVRAEQRTEQWVTVRVEPHILDPGFTLTGRSEPRLVQVRFAGRWRELGELAIERPVLFLHVRNIGRERTFALDPSMVRLPDHLGGSVTALRLTEKGYRVGVLEAGRRFTNETLPKTSWHVRSFLWAPRLGCRGIQRITMLRDTLVLSGAGVGGGSLVYANTLYEPADAFYADRQWRAITDWRRELAPYFAQAKRMLGVVETPIDSPADEVMRDVAAEMAGPTATAEELGRLRERLGLTRPWRKRGDTAERHWLQVNNIHLRDDPLWRPRDER